MPTKSDLDPITFPDHHVVYPPGTDGLIDVTKAPYFADPSGVLDCTDILCRIMDDIMRPNLEGCRRVVDRLEAATEDFLYENSFENRRENGKIFAVFPDVIPPSRIIYFPKGTYLVSNSICYSFENLQNGLGAEMNWCIRFQGESRDECVIKLADQTPGFEFGNRKPVGSTTCGAARRRTLLYLRGIT